jgi:glycosyltransferase involved in cell wall biosynthesis
MQLAKSMENSPQNQPSANIENSSRPSDAGTPARIPLVYLIRSADMYGTERMALATLEGLAADFRVVLLGPLGPAIFEAQKLGFETRTFQSNFQLVKILFQILRQYDSLTFVSTFTRYSILFMLVNFLMRRKARLFQAIHGGGKEHEDYAGLNRFNMFDITFITVSDYSRDRLIAHGVHRDRIAVVGNFLTRRQLDAMPRRPRYDQDGVRKIVLVSRVDPPKRVDLLLDALDRCGTDMSEVSFRVLGEGPDLDRMRERAGKSHPNVCFAGYVDNVPEELAKADLLLHTCPVETFGMAVLEAMAANLPSLVPDAGGTATLVRDGQNGFTFHADDPDHLAVRLIELKNAPAALLNEIAREAQIYSATQCSEEESVRKYRELFAPR